MNVVIQVALIGFDRTFRFAMLIFSLKILIGHRGGRAQPGEVLVAESLKISFAGTPSPQFLNISKDRQSRCIPEEDETSLLHIPSNKSTESTELDCLLNRINVSFE